MTKFLLIFGTRPEAIKFAPLIRQMQLHPDKIEFKICVTGQHKTMLQQVLNFFTIQEDFDLNIMRPNQTLTELSANLLISLKNVFQQYNPDYVIVQGDTTTAMMGALAAFYEKKKVIHLEAGLRSFDKYAPFPEEANRLIIGRLADIHLAPTAKSKENLINEGIDEKNILLCGNTVIDALFLGMEIIKNNAGDTYYSKFENIDFTKRIILVTGHRRENFGTPFENVCNAIKYIADKYADVEFVYPVHLNPNVQKTVHNIIGKISNVKLIEPLEYNYLIWLMSKASLVLTDSGGIQEEAPSLGKPVLVLRDVTERMEGVEAGTAKLVGTNYNNIIKNIEELLNDDQVYNKMANAVNPYGDGTTSKQIIDYVLNIALTKSDNTFTYA